jgi:hypothetical protein
MTRWILLTRKDRAQPKHCSQGSTLSALLNIMLIRWGSHVTKGAAALRCCGGMPRESCISSAAPCRPRVLPDVSLAEQPRPSTQTLVKAAQHGSSTTRPLPQAETHLRRLTIGSPPSPAPHPTHLHRNRFLCCFQIKVQTPQWLVVGRASSQSRHAPTLKLPLGGATAPTATCQRHHRPSAMQRAS